ncbi:hypothetical protein THRCLA_09420 [Thraustotheca clavata]|uniref:Peptidase M20 dimerisation domain-containing protein n=1 Tax=Thraustotheca clavata TaxID=74557 RepID=A0A1V9YX00_9STRA|nr:hypothetical protein THRCLA_09420 [Thraustotheca clavata]
MSSPLSLTLNAEAYVELLRKLIDVAEQVQNAPGLGLVPKEDVVSDIVLEELGPYLKQNGGVIEAQRIAFHEGRGHLILKYPGTSKAEETINFVGSHMDVVPANPEGWERNPFKLSVEGDKLYGRGTTDCLGHVALVTQLLVELAKNNVVTQKTISAVLIASEENGDIAGVGVETLMETGKIDFLKNGPVLWVDCSDSQPCIGTAGALTWTLKATGKLFHSGLPHLGINALELASDAIKVIQDRFYQDFGPLEAEIPYNFACGSTMKPTRIESSTNGINQIPPWCKISGDVRLSPFYDMQDLREKLASYVNDLNENITSLESRGPHSKYTLPKENLVGKLELTLADNYMEGIACSLDSIWFKSFDEATKHVKGESKPYSIMGSLPLVRDLQRAGLDLTLTGFGKSSVYHGDNEYCLLSDMKDGLLMLARFMHNVDSVAMASPLDISLSPEGYTELLRKFIGVAEHVQNAPSLGLVPKEDLISDIILEELGPYLQQNGGVIEAKRIAFNEGRGHLILKYPGTSKAEETINFIGMHMDVVPANPEGWERDPFTLEVDGDKLYGRGTTDCLGHVALVTQLFLELAKNEVVTEKTIAAVMIVSEENGEISGVGVETLMESGEIDFLKNGPVLWIDCSDSQPCIGTAGSQTWSLKATGKLFHSGLPHLGINALEMAMDAIKVIQDRFYEDFAQHEGEIPYNFACSSTMKPTQIESSTNGINQIPPWCKISGDVRLSPFYDMQELRSKLQCYVDDLNNDIASLACRGPHSKYTLPEENWNGKLELTMSDHYIEGIACSLESIGFQSFSDATKEVKGESVPFAIMGSLPLVRDLQRAGLDLTLAGFGKSSVYHGDNEYCLLSDMQDGLAILARFIHLVDTA